jgi:fucose permease
MAAFNIGFTGWSFWHYEKESLPSGDLVSVTRLPSSQEHNPRPPTTDHDTVRTAQQAVRPTGQFSSMAKAVKNKVVLLGALFIFAYQGAEVSISGWVISFLLTFRNGNPASVGYVTAGFWGGITLGRFLLTQPAHKIGEKKFVYSVVVGAAAFQLLVWFVPNIIGDAVAVVSIPRPKCYPTRVKRKENKEKETNMVNH